MKVKRLELKGFRGFDEIVLDFDTSSQRPTVFIGNNGVGKSSILDALAILLSWFINRIYYDPDSDQLIRNIRTQVNLSEKKLSEGFNFEDNDIKNSSNQVSGLIFIDYKSQETTWKLTGSRFHIPSSQLVPLGIIEKELDCLNILTTNLRSQIRKNLEPSLPIILHCSVNRTVNKVDLEIQDVFFPQILDIYENSLDKLNVDFKNFFAWFRNTEDLENENKLDNYKYEDKQLKSVRDAIHSLISEFNNLRVRRSPLRMTVNKTIGDKVEELTINQLSDGEKCLLAMVGDIARRLAIANPSLDDPLQGEGIVLIDEIELHLHPQWQHKIIPRLTETFPNCQFIVTTHSPQVLSHVQPENIYILQSTPNGIIASHPESSYGRDSNQILENTMDSPSRNEKTTKDILELFRLIDRNDFVGAKKLRQKIGSEIGFDEPELLRAGVVIKRKEILGK
jgi:predicted ATP-binding protein involved in virulence